MSSEAHFDPPNERDPAAESPKPPPKIKSVRGRQDSGGPPSRTLEGEFQKRRQRRRLDLRTLDGTLRESAKVYRELAEGRISVLEAETRSRVLRRHSEILSTIQQRDQIADLQRQLATLQDDSESLPALEFASPPLPPVKTDDTSPLDAIPGTGVTE